MKVRDLCQREVVVVTSDETLVTAARRMRDCRVGTLVVVDDAVRPQRPIGILTDRDIAVGPVADCPKEVATLQVEEVVYPGITTASEDDDVIETLHRMRELRIRRLPVVNEDGHLTGILSLDDIVAALAEQLSAVAALGRRR